MLSHITQDGFWEVKVCMQILWDNGSGSQLRLMFPPRDVWQCWETIFIVMSWEVVLHGADPSLPHSIALVMFSH